MNKKEKKEKKKKENKIKIEKLKLKKLEKDIKKTQKAISGLNKELKKEERELNKLLEKKESRLIAFKLLNISEEIEKDDQTALPNALQVETSTETIKKPVPVRKPRTVKKENGSVQNNEVTPKTT